MFFSKSYYGRYLRFLPIDWEILPSLRAGVITCIDNDHLEYSNIQLPPSPDLEVNAKDNLGGITNITDNHGNTIWRNHGHAPRFFHGRYGWELMDKMKQIGGGWYA